MTVTQRGRGQWVYDPNPEPTVHERLQIAGVNLTLANAENRDLLERVQKLEHDRAWIRPGEDSINPSHYNTGDIECIDAIRAALGHEGFKGFCQGTAIKYLWRYAHKGMAIEDLQKSEWYSDRLKCELLTVDK